MNRRSFVGSVAAFLGGLFCFRRRNQNSFRQFRIERDGMLLRGLRPMSEIRKGDRFVDACIGHSPGPYIAQTDPQVNDDGILFVPCWQDGKA